MLNPDDIKREHSAAEAVPTKRNAPPRARAEPAAA